MKEREHKSPKREKGKNLDAERVEDHAISGCDVEVENRKAQRMQPDHHLQQLLSVRFQEHFDTGMAFHHRHFHIRNGSTPLFGHCCRFGLRHGRVVEVGRTGRILRECKEV